jgi:hypothetical protein
MVKMQVVSEQKENTIMVWDAQQMSIWFADMYMICPTSFFRGSA